MDQRLECLEISLETLRKKMREMLLALNACFAKLLESQTRFHKQGDLQVDGYASEHYVQVCKASTTNVQPYKPTMMGVQACKSTTLSTPSGSIQEDTKRLVPTKQPMYNNSLSIIRLSPNELKKRKEKRLCFNCNKKFGHNHRCMILKVNESEEEDEVNKDTTFEKLAKEVG